MILDGLVAAGGLYLAVSVRPQLDDILRFTREVPGPVEINLALYPVFAVMWVLVLNLFSVYDGRKNFRLASELTNLTMGSLLAAVSMAGLLYFSFREISRALFGTYIVIAFCGMLLVRVVYRFVFSMNRQKGVQVRRVLIIGAGLVGQRIAEHIQQYTDLGLELAGFLDDDTEKRKNPLVVGRLDDMRKIISNRNVKDVVLALPTWAFHRVNQLTTELHDLPVQVWVVPDYFALALNQARVEELAGIPMIDLRAPALNDYQRMVKRVFDILITLAVMPVAVPLMGLIALLIRLDTRGPIIFSQKRVGENGRLFNMLKFRSMVEGADQLHHLVEEVGPDGKILQDKTKTDPRVTRVGNFLRKTSLDELPQVFNVLRGEMSWVGPRPELPYLVEQYQPWQRRRFAVPQGITGWWQVNGRSDKPMHQNTEDDLYYVQNYSIWLDIVILLRTIWVVVRRKGAY